MSANPAFVLESTSPADRAAIAEHRRRAAREAARQARQRAAEQGLKQVAVMLPGDQINALDSYQREHQIGTRSEALARIVEAGLPAARPRRRARSTATETPLTLALSAEDFEAFEQIKAAHGLTSDTAVFELIMKLARDVSHQQELGL